MCGWMWVMTVGDSGSDTHKRMAPLIDLSSHCCMLPSTASPHSGSVPARPWPRSCDVALCRRHQRVCAQPKWLSGCRGPHPGSDWGERQGQACCRQKCCHADPATVPKPPPSFCLLCLEFVRTCTSSSPSWRPAGGRRLPRNCDAADGLWGHGRAGAQRAARVATHL